MTRYERLRNHLREYDATRASAEVSLPSRFTPIRALGAGGMGRVTLVRDESLSREVVLKQLKTNEPSLRERSRLQREAEIMASIQHANVVGVHEFVVHDGIPFLVMDYVEGGSLAERLEGGPLTVEEACRVAVAVADGLQHVHEAGIVHRDVKPGNILLTDEGRVLLTDFGLARSNASEDRLTKTGELLGTLTYLAPEQLQDAKRADARSDVYGLGAVLYCMLTGRPPIAAGTLHTLVIQTLEQAPTDPRLLRPEIPAELAAVCLRCLAKEPEVRFQSAAALAASIRAPRLPVRAGSSAWAAAGLLVVLVLGGSLLALSLSNLGEPASLPSRSLPPLTSLNWATCQEALHQGRAFEEERAVEALSQLPPPSLELLEAISSAPSSVSRNRLLLLGYSLRGLDAQAVEVSRDLEPRLQRSAELGQSFSKLCARLDNHYQLVMGGTKTYAASLAEALRLLDLADRNRSPTPLGRVQGRRWQASFARAIAVLRAYTELTHADVPREAWDRARALAPGSLECAYLDTVEYWLLAISSRREIESPFQASLHERLLKAEQVSAHEPLFAFLRGVTLLETDPVSGRAAGEAGWLAARKLPDLLDRYGRQWTRMQGRLAEVIAREACRRLVDSKGELGRQELERAYQIGANALIGPRGAGGEVHTLGEATEATVSEFVLWERRATLGVALCLLAEGRLEAALAIVTSQKQGRALARILGAEARLIAGDVEAAHSLLVSLPPGPLADFAEYWAILAHVQSLMGDAQGCEKSLERARAAEDSFGIPWHSAAHVPLLISGEGWWPGARVAPR